MRWPGASCRRRASLSLSLGDERVVIAQQVAVIDAPDPLMSDRGGETSVHVVLPAYRAVATIPAVTAEMDAGVADRALLVDDASPDDTTSVALAHGLDVLRHPVNLGYGGSQKSGYMRALLDGADVIVMVHADDQYDPGLVPVMAQPILDGDADMVIGLAPARRPGDRGRHAALEVDRQPAADGGGEPAFGVRFSEYHTGYRAFSADLLRSIPFLRNSDSFVFDQELFAQVIAHGARVAEIPIPTRYFHEASSVSFTTSVRYGLDTLGVLARFTADRHGRSWTLLRRPAVDWPEPTGPRRRDRLREPAPSCRASASPSGALLAVALVPAPRCTSPRRPTTPSSTTRATTSYHARSLARRRGLRPVASASRPRSARPGYPFLLAGVYDVAGVARAGVARAGAAGPDRAGVHRDARGRADRPHRRAALGAPGRARGARAGRGLPAAHPHRRRAHVRAAVRRAHARVARGCDPASTIERTRYRWALLARRSLAGLAILTRANGLVLLLPLAVGVVGRAAAPGRGARWRRRRCSSPPRCATVAPWTIRNAVELHAFVPVSTQLGSALAGTYNDDGAPRSREPRLLAQRCERIDELRRIYGAGRHDPRADAREAAARSAALRRTSATTRLRRDGRRSGTTRRMLDLGGLGLGAAHLRDGQRRARLGERGGHRLLGRRAARRRRGVHASAPGGRPCSSGRSPR